MGVQDPAFPNCPSCDHNRLEGVEKVGVTVVTDDEGGIDRFDAKQPLGTWTSLWCEDCGKMLIEDGEWVIDPDTGNPVATDGSGHKTFDEF